MPLVHFTPYVVHLYKWYRGSWDFDRYKCSPYRGLRGVHSRVETLPARIMTIPENPAGDQAAQHRASYRRLQRNFTPQGPRTPEKVPKTCPESAQRRHFTNRKFTSSLVLWITSGSGAIYRNLREQVGKNCVVPRILYSDWSEFYRRVALAQVAALTVELYCVERVKRFRHLSQSKTDL